MNKETRCSKCNKLLFVTIEKNKGAKIEIKCNKCKLINKIEI